MPIDPELHPFVPSRPADQLSSPARRIPVYRSEVLVVGSGVAGLSTALAAAEEGSHVTVLSKGRLEDTNTRYAQGGLAAALGPDDAPELHAGDTLAVGRELCDPQVVAAFTAAAPEAVEWLQRIGMRFDRSAEGRLDLAREGGHRLPRVLHSGGTATGLELQRTLGMATRGHDRIDLFEHVTGIDLLRDAEGRVCGLLALVGSSNSTQVEPVFFEADSVVLATGGAGQIYRETTNPPNATGDGLAMALRAGVELRSLEFVQFHPTILYLAGAARFLISEVTRGAGGLLRDREGKAFMAEYHHDGELAPRDVVSRAIFRRIVETGDTHVYLDLTDVPDAASRFPALARITGQFGLDIATAPIPVRPAVHYFIGGVHSDLDGRTGQEGLWAVGECASTGFHGANRMGSNSLLEGLVHGRRAGRSVAAARSAATRRFLLPRSSQTPAVEGAELNLTDMTYSLKSLMWRQVGIERDRDSLEDALRRLEAWEGYLARLGGFTREGVAVVNMVQVARLVAYCALFRRESRGTHFRTDYPEPRPEWRVFTSAQAGEGGLSLRTLPAPVPLEGAATPPAIS